MLICLSGTVSHSDIGLDLSPSVYATEKWPVQNWQLLLGILLGSEGGKMHQKCTLIYLCINTDLQKV